MWEFICQHNKYRRIITNKTASRPTGLDGFVVLLDGYDAAKLFARGECDEVLDIINVNISLVDCIV